VNQFNYIIKRIEPYIYSLCRGYSIGLRVLTVDDLKQECYLKLYSIISKNKSRTPMSTDDIEKVYFRAIKHLLIDIRRTYKNDKYTHTFDIHNDGDEHLHPIAETDQSESYDTEYLLAQIKKRMKQQELKLFELMLSPNETLIRLVLNEYAEKGDRRKSGETVFQFKSVRIMKKHYAKTMKISPATISRLVESVLRKVSEVLHNENP